MASKVPLNTMLTAMDTNDLDFWSRLTPEQKKAWSPWLAMRYSSSVIGPHSSHYLIMTNELVNVDFNTLRHHPNLQWKLLALCGIGKSVRHQWIAPGKKGKSDNVADFLREVYPHMKTDDLRALKSVMTKSELMELAQSAGRDDKYIKDLVKNYE